MLKYLCLICLVILASCSKETSQKSSYYEVQGTREERVAKVVKLLQKPLIKEQVVPLTTIEDAHFFQESLGKSNDIGPSDFCSFYAIKVAPQNIALWEKSLIQLPSDNLPKVDSFLSPSQTKDWWFTKQEFGALTFYDAFILSNTHGWVGIAKSGHIYISGCTN